MWGRTNDQTRARLDALYKWHHWFAWYPVQLEHGQWAWLQTVERQSYWVSYGGSWRVNKYRQVKP